MLDKRTIIVNMEYLSQAYLTVEYYEDKIDIVQDLYIYVRIKNVHNADTLYNTRMAQCINHNGP